MAKLWLTEKNYPICSAVLRIAYWLFAIYLSNIYLQNFKEQSWFQFGLIAISVLFVVIFLIYARFLDRFFKKQTTD